MRKFWAIPVLLLSLILILPAAAQDEDDAETIADFLQNNDEYSILVEAALAADPIILETLSEGGPVTLFAPTNQAFVNLAAAFDFELIALLQDTDLLTELLLYHAVPDTLISQQVVALDGELVNPLLPDTAFQVTLDDDGTIRLNGISAIVAPFDVVLANGVVHTMADAIFPNGMEERLAALADVEVEIGPADDAAPADEADADSDEADTAPLTLPGGDDIPDEPLTEVIVTATFPSDLTLAGRVFSDPRYSTLETVLLAVAPDYVDLLNGEGTLTLLAPNNGAFDNLFFSLGIDAEDALENPELLRAILAYHVIEGVATADDLRDLDGQRVDTILDNGEFVESIGVTVSGRRILLNDVVQVKSIDLLATNGLMHSVDNVLIPQVALDALVELGLLEAQDE